MRCHVIILILLLFEASCASPSRKVLNRRIDDLSAENQILRKFVPSKGDIDLNQAGSFVIEAPDPKWHKGEVHIFRGATTRMSLMSNWGYAALYSYDLLNVQIEKNKLLADGHWFPTEGAARDSEAPVPPKKIRVTVFADKYTRTYKYSGSPVAVFSGTLQIEEIP
jgi:hypothetical protein